VHDGLPSRHADVSYTPRSRGARPSTSVFALWLTPGTQRKWLTDCELLCEHSTAGREGQQSSGCCQWRPALGLTVSATLQSFMRARGPAANGWYQGTADITSDRGGRRRHTPVDRPRTSSRSGRTAVPLRLDGSLPTHCCHSRSARPTVRDQSSTAIKSRWPRAALVASPPHPMRRADSAPRYRRGGGDTCGTQKPPCPSCPIFVVAIWRSKPSSACG
jgi:hypothetical protein